MKRSRILVFLGVLCSVFAGAGFLRSETAPTAPAPDVAPRPVAGNPAEPVRVKVIPVREAIARPVLYVLRRGLKEAQAEGMQAVVIDMETPGGELGVTLEIMEALDKFEGQTLVYVNKEAISAGAIISSVADEIHFAPGAVIGAAAAVSGGGQEVSETMKRKLNSYLSAKVRSFSAGKGYRSEVIKAMMDADYEFKIGDTVIKPKGELLSLTDAEAATVYGDPARALLSAGTHATLEDMLTAKFGKNNCVVSRLEISWSETLASWISAVAPVLMGLGLLCVFIEFKTPGFGAFGITGGVLLALVFFGHHAAGLSGHEPALLFLVGVALVAVEIFIAPGTLAAGLAGALLMLGALAWSMLDLWPGEWPEFDAGVWMRPLVSVALALVVALVAGALSWKLLPRGWLFRKLAVGGASNGPAHRVGETPAFSAGDIKSLIGREGVAVTALSPSGHVMVDGQRFEAKLVVGALDPGARLRVVARGDFALLVEPLE